MKKKPAFDLQVAGVEEKLEEGLLYATNCRWLVWKRNWRKGCYMQLIAGGWIMRESGEADGVCNGSVTDP